MRRYRVLGAVTSALVWVVMGQAQTAEQPHAPGISPAPNKAATDTRMLLPYGSNRRMSIDVVITDQLGKQIPGLTAEDFTINDNKQPQKLAAFHATVRTVAPSDPPVEVMLVLDEYNEGVAEVSHEREELRKFLTKNNGRLTIPISLTVFSNSGVRATNPTLNGNALGAYVDQIKMEIHSIARSAGGYGAMERANRSIDALGDIVTSDDARRPGRKLLIWMGAGWPVITSSALMAQLTRKQEDAAFGAAVRAANLLRMSRITLYTANTVNTDTGVDANYHSYLKAATSGKDIVFGDLGLEVISAQSGGQVLNGSTDLEEDLNKCISDANAFYTLSFDAPPAEHADEYHAMSVTVDKPGLTARTITGYYSQP